MTTTITLGIATFQPVVESGKGTFVFSNGALYGDGLPAKAIAVFPHNGTLLSFSIQAQGGIGHSNLPQYKPSWTLKSIDSAGNWATVAYATDPSTTGAVYDSLHTISNTFGSGIVLDPSKDYWLEVYGESGTNSLPGQMFRVARAVFA